MLYVIKNTSTMLDVSSIGSCMAFSELTLYSRYENQGGASMQPTKLSENRGSGRSDRRCVLSAIEDEHLGSNGQAEYISVRFLHLPKARLPSHFGHAQAPTSTWTPPVRSY